MTNLDIFWVLTAAQLVVLMQAGFGALEAGLTRAKNSINVAIKNLADFVISCLLFWAVGYGVVFGPTWGGFVGLGGFFVQGDHEVATTLMFHMAFCGTATTIMSGALAERSKFSSYLMATVLVSGLIYPVVAHVVWNPHGALRVVGFVDFAGGTVVHVVGGAVALAGTIVVGPRLGRFATDGTRRKMTPSSLPLAVLGCLILTFGWLGFNGGSTMAFTQRIPAILVNTILAACMGGAAATAVDWKRRGSSSAETMINGVLAGLVAVTAGADAFSQAGAALVGATGGLVALEVQRFVERQEVDDVVGAVPVHLAAGILGTVGAGVLGDASMLDHGHSRLFQTLIQLAGALGVGAFAFTSSYVGFRALEALVGVRVSAEDELRGLNFAEHGATTEIFELLQVMDAVGGSGDLSGRAKADPYTDVGQIAKKYNDVLDTIEGQAQKIDAQNRERQTVLFSIEEGLIAMDDDMRIRAGWSAAAEGILGTSDLLGKDLGALLFEDTRDGQRQRERLEGLVVTACSLFIPEQFEELASNAPSWLRRRDPETGDDLHYAVSYSPIIEDGEITGVIVLLSDQSEVEKLRAGTSKGFRMLARTTTRLAEILEDEKTLESSAIFLAEAVPLVEGLVSTFENVETIDVARIFREMHTIKGGASMLELAHLTHFAHAAETVLDDFRSGALTAEEVSEGPLREYTSGLRDGLLSLDRLWKTARKTGAEDLASRWRAVASAAEQSIHDVAESLGKRVRVEVTTEAGLVPTAADIGLLHMALVHLGRNAASHGLETAEERTRSGKLEIATIGVSLRKLGGKLEFRFEDDGRGIDRGRIADLAFERGVTETRLNDLSDAELLAILATPGFSSATEVSKISGRGVGLDAVVERLQERGGTVRIETTQGEQTLFVLTWPVDPGALESAA